MKAVIVLYDSLNRNYLPCYNETCETIAPNFERLAKKSVTFDQSFIGSMPCMPARRDLHTGRYNFLHREWGPLEPFDDSCFAMLKKQGIYTHLISSHYHYWEAGGSTYHTQYSSWEAVRGKEGDKWKGSVKEPQIPEVVRIPFAHSGGKVTSLWRYEWVNREYIQSFKDFPEEITFQLGCEFIEKNHDADQWVLQIESLDPHEPFYAPQEFLDLYPEEYDGKYYDWPRGEVTETEEEIAHIRRQYKATVSMCDYHLGKVLDLFDQYDLWKDTMLIVSTDHGVLLGEHGWWSKNLMPYFDEIANTPLFIYDPRTKIQNERRDSLVQMIDWGPTLLSFFGLETTKEMLGKDLKETIEKDTCVHEDGILYGTFSGHVTYTDGEYTYFRTAVEGQENNVYNYTLMPCHMFSMFTPEELQQATLVEPFSFTKGCKVLKVPSKDLYDVARFGNLLYNRKKDPGQTHPLQDQDIEERMKQKMKKLMVENEAPQEQYQRLGME